MSYRVVYRGTIMECKTPQEAILLAGLVAAEEGSSEQLSDHEHKIEDSPDESATRD